MLSYFVRHRTAANLLLVAMIVLGLAAVPNMRAQFFPDIVIDEVDVEVLLAGRGRGGCRRRHRPGVAAGARHHRRGRRDRGALDRGKGVAGDPVRARLGHVARLRGGPAGDRRDHDPAGGGGGSANTAEQLVRPGHRRGHLGAGRGRPAGAVRGRVHPATLREGRDADDDPRVRRAADARRGAVAVVDSARRDDARDRRRHRWRGADRSRRRRRRRLARQDRYGEANRRRDRGDRPAVEPGRLEAHGRRRGDGDDLGYRPQPVVFRRR